MAGREGVPFNGSKTVCYLLPAHPKHGVMDNPLKHPLYRFTLLTIGVLTTLAGAPIAMASETATNQGMGLGKVAGKGSPATNTNLNPPTIIQWTSWSSASEADSGIQLYLSVLQGSGGRVRVQTLNDGTAIPGEDFEPVDEEFDMTNSKRLIVTIPLLADSRIEGRETIPVRITPVSENTVISFPEVTLTVSPDVTVGPDKGIDYVSESDRVVRIPLLRSGAVDSPQTLRVGYRVEGRAGYDDSNYVRAAAARPNVDFVPTEGMIEFGPGVTWQMVEVPLLNNAVPDGPHAFVLALTLVDPPASDGIIQGDPVVVISPDERSTLRQQVTLLPYLGVDSHLLSVHPIDTEPPRLLPRSAGKTLVILGRRALQLNSAGLPDAGFGGGTGQRVASEDEFEGERLPTPRQLSDGRLVFIPEYSGTWPLQGSRIFRWTDSGIPDPTFGGGLGRIELTNDIKRVFRVTDDGGVLLSTETVAMDFSARYYLRRLLPSGQTDPAFVVSELIGFENIPNGTASLEVAPDGRHWLITQTPELETMSLRLLESDGQENPSFSERPGVTRLFGFDSQGRAYLQLDPAMAGRFGDDSQGGLVRFSADGNYDPAYRPLTNGTRVIQAEIEGDGTALTVLEGNVILDLTADGSTGHVYSTHGIQGQVLGASRSDRGRLLLSIFECAIMCLPIPYFLEADGTLMEAPFNQTWSPQFDVMEDATGKWSYLWNDGNRLFRTLAPAENPRVGFTQTGVFSSAQTVRVLVQRDGSTAQSAVVRGRLLPWSGQQWDESNAIPFEVSFAEGVAERSLDLPLTNPTVGAPIRSFLVRLESATGCELSLMNECRLWLLPEPMLPRPGYLGSALLPGPDTADVVWLLAHWPSGGNALLESKTDPDPNSVSVNFNAPFWWRWIPNSSVTFGSVTLLPISTDNASRNLFRMRY